jgi:hypothetical protein
MNEGIIISRVLTTMNSKWIEYNQVSRLQWNGNLIFRKTKEVYCFLMYFMVTRNARKEGEEVTRTHMCTTPIIHCYASLC